ncbi:hypothetical protein AB1Y20_022556 [Prymnesium parvum]|uniref:Uncharacterized protein n=1 Tax=Prymnesium parvum TaxID=97485 RepID=A0AB34JHJ9_PRYPA
MSLCVLSFLVCRAIRSYAAIGGSHSTSEGDGTSPALDGSALPFAEGISSEIEAVWFGGSPMVGSGDADLVVYPPSSIFLPRASTSLSDEVCLLQGARASLRSGCGTTCRTCSSSLLSIDGKLLTRVSGTRAELEEERRVSGRSQFFHSSSTSNSVGMLGTRGMDDFLAATRCDLASFAAAAIGSLRASNSPSIVMQAVRALHDISLRDAQDKLRIIARRMGTKFAHMVDRAYPARINAITTLPNMRSNDPSMSFSAAATDETNTSTMTSVCTLTWWQCLLTSRREPAKDGTT